MPLLSTVTGESCIWIQYPFVVTASRRFIPIERWPLIVLSLFACHNETRQSSHFTQASSFTN